MQTVSARDFRSNQGKYLNAAKAGHQIMLRSKYGDFQLVPVNNSDSLTERICEGLREIKMVEDGKLPRKTLQELIDEL